ncbi:hypothetical protein EJB05_09865, partial [Eragrostis curvula]
MRISAMTFILAMFISLAAFSTAGDACNNVPRMTWADACLNSSSTPSLYNLCGETLQHAPAGAAKATVYAVTAVEAAKASYEATTAAAEELARHGWLPFPVSKPAFELCVRLSSVASARMAAVIGDMSKCEFQNTMQEYKDTLSEYKDTRHVNCRSAHGPSKSTHDRFVFLALPSPPLPTTRSHPTTPSSEANSSERPSSPARRRLYQPSFPVSGDFRRKIHRHHDDDEQLGEQSRQRGAGSSSGDGEQQHKEKRGAVSGAGAVSGSAGTEAARGSSDGERRRGSIGGETTGSDGAKQGGDEYIIKPVLDTGFNSPRTRMQISAMTFILAMFISLAALSTAGDACDNVPRMTWADACLKSSSTPSQDNLCGETLQHVPDGAAEVTVYALTAAKAAKASYEATTAAAEPLAQHGWLPFPGSKPAFELCVRQSSVASARMVTVIGDMSKCEFHNTMQEYKDTLSALHSCREALMDFPGSPLEANVTADLDVTAVAYGLGALVLGR